MQEIRCLCVKSSPRASNQRDGEVTVVYAQRADESKSDMTQIVSLAFQSQMCFRQSQKRTFVRRLE